jgi:WD40 repeat protein
MDENSLGDLLSGTLAGEPPIGPIVHKALRAGTRVRRLRAGAASGVTVFAAAAIGLPVALGLPSFGPARPSASASGHGAGAIASIGTKGRFPHQVTFSPSGKILGTADFDGDARLWSVSSQRQLGTAIAVPGARVMAVAFSPSGALLATADSDGTARLWSVASHRQIGKALDVASNKVLGVAFSPNGKALATAAGDETTRLWDVATHRQIGKVMISAKRSPVVLAFSPDGRVLVTTDARGFVRLWNAATQRQIGQPFGLAGTNSASFSPNGKELATAGFGSLRSVQVWNVATHRKIGSNMSAGQFAAWGVVFAPNGRELVTTDADGTIRQFSSATHKQIRRPIKAEPHDGILTEAISPVAEILATAQQLGPTRLWKLSGS